MQDYITTPIYYINGDPHIGHAHTSIMADILKRNSASLGNDVVLSTGTDEHGQKNQQASQASGLDYQTYIDKSSLRFRQLFEHLLVDFDIFAKTSRPAHKQAVQYFIQKLFDDGLINKQDYEGKYCSGCEQFKKESDLNADGRCPDHANLEITVVNESNYFLSIEPFRNEIVEAINSGRFHITPEQYQKEVLNLLADPLEDLCISRPKNRVALGVDLPLDEDYTVYVWFDALINYLSNLDWPARDVSVRWVNTRHLIGKDILKTHAVYWPAMLLAAGAPLPRQLDVHGHWVGPGGVKMSKSLGNAIDPVELMNSFGAEPLRFYLAKNMKTRSDSQISVDLVIDTYNSDLANNIGNLYSRALKFCSKHFPGGIPDRCDLDSADRELRSHVLGALAVFGTQMSLSDISTGIEGILSSASRLNEYFSSQQPWTLVKTDEGRARCATVIYVTLDCIRLVLSCLEHVLPVTARAALANLPAYDTENEPFRVTLDWLASGSRICEFENYFPRIIR
jgi:methionyl-tRNA synthetase